MRPRPQNKMKLVLIIVIIIASVLNVMHMLDLVPKDVIQFGLAIVVLCSVIYNIIYKERNTSVQSTNASPKNVWVYICVALIWGTTYAIAIIL